MLHIERLRCGIEPGSLASQFDVMLHTAPCTTFECRMPPTTEYKSCQSESMTKSTNYRIELYACSPVAAADNSTASSPSSTRSIPFPSSASLVLKPFVVPASATDSNQLRAGQIENSPSKTLTDSRHSPLASISDAEEYKHCSVCRLVPYLPIINHTNA